MVSYLLETRLWIKIRLFSDYMHNIFTYLWAFGFRIVILIYSQYVALLWHHILKSLQFIFGFGHKVISVMLVIVKTIIFLLDLLSICLSILGLWMKQNQWLLCQHVWIKVQLTELVGRIQRFWPDSWQIFL